MANGDEVSLADGAYLTDLLDALGSRDGEEAAKLLDALIEESELRCGVLLSVSDIPSATAIAADREFSLTREGTLKQLSSGWSADDPDDGGGGDADVIPLPKHAKEAKEAKDAKDTEDGESRGVGS